jgi:hypothetical protein
VFQGDDAKTFGSLIRIPEVIGQRLHEITDRCHKLVQSSDLNRQRLGELFQPIVKETDILSRRYDAVVANPPYLGAGGMNARLKRFGETEYRSLHSDTFSMFISRALDFSEDAAFSALVTPMVWLFIASYRSLRSLVYSRSVISNLVQLEYNAFEPACVPVCAFVLRKLNLPSSLGTYIDLTRFKGAANQPLKTIEAICSPSCYWKYFARASDFVDLPGQPVAYSLDPQLSRTFSLPGNRLGDVATIFEGLKTRDNERFVRCWFEVDANQVQRRWKPYSKGGGFRKWFGNDLAVVDWNNNGHDLKAFKKASGACFDGFETPTITYSTLSSSAFSARRIENSFFGGGGGGILGFGSERELLCTLGFLNSDTNRSLLQNLSPTLNFEVGTLASLPLPALADGDASLLSQLVQEAVALAEWEWNCFEQSWAFEIHPLLRDECHARRVSESLHKYIELSKSKMHRLYEIEKKINSSIRTALEQSDAPKTCETEMDVTWRHVDSESEIARLISYAIGCMMGRYSLDEPGLIYASRENIGFDHARYLSFPADEDGVVPITHAEWFRDDATNRFVEFIAVVWGSEELEENLQFVGDMLGRKCNEDSRLAIRRYMADSFFKAHLGVYKGRKSPPRPIYWFLSSGKAKAFQALVYLHRYNEGTLARMRTEYVIPLQGKMSARIDHLDEEIASATSTSHRKKLDKEQSKLKKQLEELREFDEKLRHYADQRISLDLDDGVKVNYGKFGDLLAEVKAVTGKNPE